ncbi:MAG: 30S ribosomal protein S9 [Candidatus Marinimicrobia bacterium]|nr:30S ribosomal protein S9 [Candidatus Neomarinimicrobiota bacterium]MCH8837404.1 30S ribosomal protein S9 [Candidatus Neomarinimicrobiota bacterium]
MAQIIARSIGRRKTAVARLRLFDGKGQISINDRKLDDYFPRLSHKIALTEPLQLVGLEGQYNIIVNVRGGGPTGQAGAIRLALARALEKVDGDFRPLLKKAGMLTRDAREVERKKYGQPGARKKFQFSKR